MTRVLWLLSQRQEMTKFQASNRASNLPGTDPQHA